MLKNKEMLKKLSFLFILTCYSVIILSQTDPNGYNIFYYTSGTKASEGTLREGKPDGYWKTYYPDGKMKSEGNRRNYMLDSAWVFYAATGDTNEVINYFNDKKSGYSYKYAKIDTLGKKINYLKSKELYLNDIKQGQAFYFFYNGRVYQEINYKDGTKHGIAKEYTEDGVLIEIIDYKYNNIARHESFNRYDKDGKKNGTWKEFYLDGTLKIESIYKNGVLNGYYKEFDNTGLLIKMIKYLNGEIIEEITEQTQQTEPQAVVKVEKYDNGAIKNTGGFINEIPIGVHKEFAEDGKVLKTDTYNDLGIKISEGIIEEDGKKQGNWTYLYQTGEKLSIGNYKNNLKEGEWTFYAKNGNISQKGSYINDKPHGQWKWYYENGKLLRDENYTKGILNGAFVELSETGDTLVTGNYYNGQEDGIWKYKIGDQYWTGKYAFGAEAEEWNYFYHPEMKLKVTCSYVQGERHGIYKEFYLDGTLKEQGEYLMGKKQKDWKYYEEDGMLRMTITYSLDEIIKVDGLVID